jgi:hypothetical protein
MHCTSCLHRWVSALRLEINSVEAALDKNSVFTQTFLGHCDHQFDEARNTRADLQKRFRLDD